MGVLFCMNTRSLILHCAVVCTAPFAGAATLFVDPLTSDAGHFLPGTGTGAINYTAGGAVFAGTGDGGRRYLHTVDTNYYSTSFTATVNFFLPTSATGSSVLFFGIGSGDIGTFYQQPDQNLAGHSGAWVGWDPRDLGGGSGRIEGVTILNGPNSNILALGETPFTTTTAYGPNSGPNTAVMSWNAATRQVTWTLDIGSNGSIEETVSTTLNQNIVDRWNGTTASDPSSIFFGGNGGITVTGFSVVPEPGSVTLAGLGVLALLKRRRR